jgi:ubiquinone/menaquinone biosynthesis C-methylase UbiE
MKPNQQQSEAWNGAESAHYVDHSERYDLQLRPIADALFERVQLEPHHAVLDVGCGCGCGCGCGATTLTAARRAHTALGADISEPLIEVAADRARAAFVENAEFVVADAQTYNFAEEAFDFVISQFGVMFFDDPVPAFANLRRALTPGGRIAFTCWQGLEANEWVLVVAGAVAEHLALPALGGQAGGPGMFALKIPDETAALLDAAGFTQIGIEPISPTVLLGGGGSLDESIEILLGTGIARGVLGQVEPDARPTVIQAVRVSLAERYESGVGIRLGTGVWLVSAHNQRIK